MLIAPGKAGAFRSSLRDARSKPEISISANWFLMPNATEKRNTSDFALQSPVRLSLASRDWGRQTRVILRQFPPPDLEQAWQDFLSRVESPDLYVTPHYFLEPHWAGKNPFAILAMNEGRVTGVITGIVKGNSVSCGLPSRPQLLIEPAGPGTSPAEILSKTLVSEFPRARTISAYCWSSKLAPDFKRQGFGMRQLQGDVVLDLRAGPDALFESFHDNRKRNIRAALRRGVEIYEVNTDQDLADYWEIHCRWQKTERKTIRADATFERAAAVHQLRNTHRRFIARHNGTAIAATTLRFYRGGLIEYAANCSMDEYNQLRPNDLLIWKTIQWACEQGFSRYSLGGAHPFLAKCGGTLVPIYRYRLDQTFLRRVEMQERAEEIGRRYLRHFRPSQSAAKEYFKKLFATSGTPGSPQA